MMELYQAMVQAGAEVQAKTNRKVQQTRFVGAQLMMPRYEQHWAQIYYMEPTYQANGRNGCRIYYDDGWVEEIPARLDYVLNSLAQLVHINLKAMQEQSRQWLAGQRLRCVPLVVNEYFILLPVAGRKPLRKDDTATGYVVLQKIAAIKAIPGGALLTFCTNDAQVALYHCPRTIRRCMALGLQLQKICMTRRLELLAAAAAALETKGESNRADDEKDDEKDSEKMYEKNSQCRLFDICSA